MREMSVGPFCAGNNAKTEVLDNKDGTYTVTYIPLMSGMYTLLLKYGGKPVLGFPAKVMVDPAIDTSKVKVFGPGVEGQGSVFPHKHLGLWLNPRTKSSPLRLWAACSLIPFWSLVYSCFQRGHHRFHRGRPSSDPEWRRPRESRCQEPVRSADRLFCN